MMNRKLILALGMMVSAAATCTPLLAQVFTPLDAGPVEARESAVPAGQPKPQESRKAASASSAGVDPHATRRSEVSAPDDSQPNGKVERVVFDRRPINVVLVPGRERLVHLPWESAIEVPPDSDIEIQIIGTTAYLRAEKPTSKTRVVAQGMNGEGYIPLDVTVRRDAAVADEIEVFLKREPKPQAAGSQLEADDESPDMVEMSRYCLQQIFAPQRLIRPLPGLRQIEVRPAPIAGLYRGASIQTTPIGAWRSSDLYVTAVRLTNRGSTAVELDMEQLRGHWIAATPQHWRLARASDEADTTAVCLVSEQPFDAAR